MAKNPYQLHNSPISGHLGTSTQGQSLLEASQGQNEAWQQGHDSRDAEVEALRAALEFYADPDTYFAIGFFPDPPCGEFMDDFDNSWDHPLGVRPGKRARAAITKWLDEHPE